MELVASLMLCNPYVCILYANVQWLWVHVSTSGVLFRCVAKAPIAVASDLFVWMHLHCVSHLKSPSRLPSVSHRVPLLLPLYLLVLLPRWLLLLLLFPLQSNLEAIAISLLWTPINIGELHRCFISSKAIALYLFTALCNWI